MVKMKFHLLVSSVIILLLTSKYYSDASIQESRTVRSTEAFFIPISHDWFPNFRQDDPLEYTASLQDMPDLPHWMFSYPLNSSNGFLYGSAEEPGDIRIEIVAMNKNTYETASTILQLNVEPREKIFQYEVEIKFSNLNVDDMFRSDRLKRLVEVFQSNLWKGNEDIYVTKVVSSVDVGGRLPLNPNMKEGVVVRVGGTHPFSRDLEDLEREVRPLRNRSPCPRDYKRTSVEHLFRSRNFVADWCSFRLVSENHERLEGSSGEWSEHSVPLTSDEYVPQGGDLPRRDLGADFVVSIVIPTSIVVVLSTALTCIMCCNKETMEKNNDGTSLQLDHYNSVPVAHNQVKRLSGKREGGLHRSGSTPASSIPGSCTDSPSSTLPKGFSLRSSGRSGAMQPPPPPYATSSFPPSYVGSTRSNLTPCPP